ncbi:hypothetical protein OG758_22750 [Streptomyces sp. NBC_01474]|uniref:hypothetical protein n=1 Tax=Streptomyces sp. NBC_01474 TaxID=2903880 RepID=UPI002DD7C371|nr:hypothetical protein [Streptomyces sp. NBC_01474]WSD96724.1 hypothetical protein OG758_22750 [Streptomyces sp. NBC_01474]
MAKNTIARRATLYPLIDDRLCSARHLTAHQATAGIRSARRQPSKVVDAVHVYATTDREGTPLHIGYVHYTPGYWTGVADVIDVYEIPTDALTDL